MCNVIIRHNTDDSSFKELFSSFCVRIVPHLGVILRWTRLEGEKLQKYGKIGQPVKIFGRSVSPNGEISGKIIGLESNLPFDNEIIWNWKSRDLREDKASAIKGLPSSKIKVFVTNGAEKGSIITNVTNSEWRPIE